MPCVDKDKFDLLDHGHDVGVALQQLMRIPSIKNGALGDVIGLIQLEVLPLVTATTWVAQGKNNVGNATGFFRVKNDNVNRIELMGVALTLMEDKRGQVIHELVHALDMRYFFFNIDHPPLAARLGKRVPSLQIYPLGNILKYNVMDLPFIDNVHTSSHSSSLTYLRGLARNNSLLSTDQRAALMLQLDYAARADKLHAEFTANIAQCLSLLYQWGFTGAEKGFFGRPRSVALMTRKMESLLTVALQLWRGYVPPSRAVGAVVQLRSKDSNLEPRIYPLDGVHFERDEWWELVD